MSIYCCAIPVVKSTSGDSSKTKKYKEPTEAIMDTRKNRRDDCTNYIYIATTKLVLIDEREWFDLEVPVDQGHSFQNCTPWFLIRFS